ncbi:hypothetical protein HYFRA_00011915 [Hymenoscyphus fraxineus]|uniref:Uncharacterized protein n=1 Tax=Hymenoscyphus fraxineus TaxID=746836 RepID=A0A9N9L001_9HELO|nr:hypothetical protein HYFRA_00011915 [Hymenoscyphus fraxineus]
MDWLRGRNRSLSRQNPSIMPPNLDNQARRSSSRTFGNLSQSNVSRLPRNICITDPAARNPANGNPSSSRRNDQVSHLAFRITNTHLSSSRARNPTRTNQTSHLPSQLDNRPRSRSRPRQPSRNQHSRLPSLMDNPHTSPRRRQIPTNSTFTSQHDIDMATQQTHIDSLPPDQQRAQDLWARNQLELNGSSCPGGYKYQRTEQGYICPSGVHLVTHELLQEGRGRFYQLNYEYGSRGVETVWAGPFSSMAEVGEYERS